MRSPAWLPPYRERTNDVKILGQSSEDPDRTLERLQQVSKLPAGEALRDLLTSACCSLALMGIDTPFTREAIEAASYKLLQFGRPRG